MKENPVYFGGLWILQEQPLSQQPLFQHHSGTTGEEVKDKATINTWSKNKGLRYGIS